MDREQFLQERTHKGLGIETSQRVRLCITEEVPDPLAPRDLASTVMELKHAQSLISHLVQLLQERGHLSAADIDELLFRAA